MLQKSTGAIIKVKLNIWQLALAKLGRTGEYQTVIEKVSSSIPLDVTFFAEFIFCYPLYISL